MLYSINRVNEIVLSYLTSYIPNLKEELRNIGYELIDWRVEKDTLSLVLLLYGRLDNTELVEKTIEMKLLEKLFSLNVKTEKIVMSYIGDKKTAIINFTPLAFFARLIMFYSYVIMNQYLKSINEKELFSIFDHYDINRNIFSSFINIRTNVFNQFKNEFDEIASKWSNVLNKLSPLDLSILYLIFALPKKISSEFILEKLSQLLKLDIKELFSRLSKLSELRLIRNDKTILITSFGSELLTDFLELINSAETYLIRTCPANILNKIEAHIQVKNIVHRSGLLEKFSTLKLMESLFASKIDINILFKLIESIKIHLNGREFVGERELTFLLEKILDIMDPTHISSAQFHFFINAPDYIHVELRGHRSPLSRRILEQLIIDQLNIISKKKAPPALLTLLSSNIFHSLKTFLIVAFTDPTRTETIILNEDFMKPLIDKILTETVPFYSDLRASSIDDTKILSHYLQQSANLFDEVVKISNENAFKLFLNASKYLIWFSLIYLGYWPHPSLVSSTTILINIIKQAKSGESDSKFFKRLEEFARRSSQILIKTHTYFSPKFNHKIRKELIELSKFGKRLCEQFLERISVEQYKKQNE